MEDAEYVFMQTSMERKRVARGAYNKVRGGGRVVKMPSDAMSKKEREGMNGEMKSYDLSKPMDWNVFRDAPRDIQQEYLDKIAGRFKDVPESTISELVFKKSRSSLWRLMKDNGLMMRREDGHRKVKEDSFFKTADGEAFLRWVNNEDRIVAVVPFVEPENVQEDEKVSEVPVVESIDEPKMPKKVDAKSIDINNIAVLLKALSGTGAKLTIEIVL